MSTSASAPSTPLLDNEIVQQYLEVNSFLRRVLQKTELATGANQTIKIKKVLTKDQSEELRCVMVNQSGQAITATPPNEYVTLIPYTVTELSQDGDLDALKVAIHKQEAKLLLQTLDQCVQVTGNRVEADAFTPEVFSYLRQMLQNKGVATYQMILADDIFLAMQSSHTFRQWFVPVAQQETMQTGLAGSLLNVVVLTDFFWDHKVIPKGRFYILGKPNMVGRLGISEFGINKYATGSRRFTTHQTCGIIDPAAIGMGVINPDLFGRSVNILSPEPIESKVNQEVAESATSENELVGFEKWFQGTNFGMACVSSWSREKVLFHLKVCWLAAFPDGEGFFEKWFTKPLRRNVPDLANLKETLRRVWNTAEATKECLGIYGGCYQESDKTTIIDLDSEPDQNESDTAPAVALSSELSEYANDLIEADNDRFGDWYRKNDCGWPTNLTDEAKYDQIKACWMAAYPDGENMIPTNWLVAPPRQIAGFKDFREILQRVWSLAEATKKCLNIICKANRH